MRRLFIQLFSGLVSFPVAALAFTGIIGFGQVEKKKMASTTTETSVWTSFQPPFKRSAGVSFLASSSSSSSSLAAPIKGTTHTEQQQQESSSEDENRSNMINKAFQELCHGVNAKPNGLLRLDESVKDGIRGVFVQRSVPKGEVLLSIPLTFCLRDDNPPEWMPQKSCDDRDDDDDDDDGYYNPSAWATRLAACLLDLQLSSPVSSGGSNDGNNSNNKSGNMKLWLDLLPNANLLRASLPIHWSEETLQSAQCSALELAVDTSFFARAQAREDIMQALNKYNAASTLNEETKRRLCDNALDMVQTRSCRVLVNKKPSSSSSLSEDDAASEITISDDDPQPVRLLAPVFDFINHPSQGKANAAFALEEGTNLVVRSLRRLEANTEVLIDYGESARPAWRCLSSYGFVPTYEGRTIEREGDDDNVPEEENDEQENHVVGEVFVNGVRYQVGPSSVPQEMVAAMAAALNPTLLDCDQEQEEIVLTKEIAINLGQRIAEDAFYKLLDPPSLSAEIVENDENDNNYDDELQTPEQILSSSQAAALRFYQHRVLMDCSLGLRDWAMQQQRSLSEI